MPLEINVNDLINSMQPQGGGSNSPYILLRGQLVQNPAYINPLQSQQLSTLQQGPTPGAITAGAYQTAANEGARVAASALGQEQVPLTPEQLQNAIDPTTGQEVPVGSTPAGLMGKSLISATDKASRQELNAVNNVIDQIKSASSSVNTESGQAGTDRSIKQLLRSYTLKASGDPNAQLLDSGVRGLLGLVAAGGLNVSRFSPEEISALQQDFPTSQDTKEVAQAKISRIDNILKVKARDLGVGSTSSTPLTAPTASPSASSPMPTYYDAQGNPVDSQTILQSLGGTSG